ncbi:MAG: glycine cleavage system protein H [Candidatus Alcyoniella australis]|nr:glycine cleavage system protein H [Candidatus Alcyoniella australis]
MVPILVILTLAAFILIDALVVRRLAEKKANVIVKANTEQAAPELEQQQDRLYHEGHTWVEVQRAAVAVGLDDFAKRFIGDIEQIDVPSPGAKIKRGSKLWTIKFGDRKLSQPAPISGRIIEVNKRALKNPHLLVDPDGGETWIMKILPTALNSELHDLYSSSRFAKWTEFQRNRFFRDAFPDLGMVYGDGGELVEGAALTLDKEQWEQLASQMFYNREKKNSKGN